MAINYTVSIHAPAWGATRIQRGFLRRLARFNPRARVGRDWDAPVRVWMRMGFNPRARVGRDADTASTSIAKFNVSIHAPAWGATSGVDDRRQAGQQFQSTRPRGARHLQIYYKLGNHEFQSTRPRGARLTKSTISGLGSIVSIHAPAWGATSIMSMASLSWYGFNPRARVGRDD